MNTDSSVLNDRIMTMTTWLSSAFSKDYVHAARWYPLSISRRRAAPCLTTPPTRVCIVLDHPTAHRRISTFLPCLTVATCETAFATPLTAAVYIHSVSYLIKVGPYVSSNACETHVVEGGHQHGKNKLCEQCDERCDEQCDEHCLYHLYESKLIPTTTSRRGTLLKEARRRSQQL